MLKKLISIAASAAAVMLMAASAYAYTDVSADSYCYESVMRLGDLGIVSGYEDGSFRPDATITRAEYARIIVSAMDKETAAKSTGLISSFADVPGGLWSAPYINYVSTQGIVAGYSDGSFQPDKTISFAESLTILLRVLGYTEESVGYFWPNNYVDAASSLGISEGMGYGVNQPVTRGDAAVMLDRALFADLSGEKDKTLLEDTGYTLMKDMIVLESGNENSKLLPAEVRLSDSKVYTSKMSLAASSGQFADYAVVDKDGYLVALKVTGKGANKAANQMSVYVNGITDNTVNYISNGATGSYRFDNGFTVYVDGEKTTFAQAKSSIKAGTDVTFYGEVYGSWSFAVVSADDEVAPVIAKHNYSAADTNLEGQTITQSGLTVYRDGKAASLSDIALNDVVYYNTRTNVMDVYSKKITGIYYDAQPSKAYVESVTVGNKSYAIGYDAAANALNATAGSFEIGDRVTLLLGKDDKAVFAVELSATAIGDYGVVLSTGEQIAASGANEGSSEIYADVFMTDGEVYRLVTDRDYNTCIGQLVRISYENGTAKLVQQNKPSSGSGVLDKTNRTLNGKTILKDAAVIQRTSYEAEKYAECKLLDLDTMTAKEITSSQLLGIVSGTGFGDISLLFVKDVESIDSFGVVSGTVKGGDGSITGYKIYSNGGELTYQTSFTVAGLSVGMPVMYNLTGSDSDKLRQLYKIKAGTVSASDGSRIKVGDNVYSMSADVQIVNISDPSNYATISVDELKNVSGTVTLYSDTSSSSACVIRVITVK